MYDKFKENGLYVKDENGALIEDFELHFDEDGSLLKNDDLLLKNAGTYKINIVKDGYETQSFNITILQSTDFVQKLSMIHTPTKDIYSFSTPSKIDLSGFLIRLKTSYKNNNKKTRRYDEILEESDLLVQLDGEDVSGKEITFTHTGLYNVVLSYKPGGWVGNEVSSVNYKIYVKDDSTSPIQYVDNTITSTVSETDSYSVSIKNTSTEAKSTTQPKSKNPGYYTPDEVDASFNIQTYGRKNYINWSYTPSTGKVPFLIVPIIIPGDESKATAENLDLIQNAFFGTSSSLYFESLHSYYYRSSYGQLDITGVVTDFFDLKKEIPKFSSKNSLTETSTVEIANSITRWATDDLGYDLTEFDSDNDGLIDGMWMIYLSASNGDGAYWAFSYSTGNTGNVQSPVVNNFGWAGIDFLNDGFMMSNENYANKDCDAHVLIHETGHMLGSTDYYSYNASSTYYDPTGKALTMSYNSNDHDLYTKMLFGWVTPYIVYDTSKLSIVASQAKKDQLIVIPYNSKTFKTNSEGKVLFNMFDEYIVLEYYTDDDLNSKDYDCYEVNHIRGKGIRMLHIDNRLAYSSRFIGMDEDNIDDVTINLFADPDEILTTSKPLVQFICNSESGSRAESQRYGVSKKFDAYDEIRIISADKRKLSQINQANTNTLFTSGKVFTMSSYSNSFPNGTSFDNGESFQYEITF